MGCQIPGWKKKKKGGTAMHQGKKGEAVRKLTMIFLPVLILAVSVLAFHAKVTSGLSSSPPSVSDGGVLDNGGPDGQVGPEVPGPEAPPPLAPPEDGQDSGDATGEGLDEPVARGTPGTDYAFGPN